MRGVWWPPALTSEQPAPRRLLIGILLLYAAATLLIALHHEPWRDEADSWLVARDLPLSDVVGWSRLAGTPWLWYAVLLPFARSGMPYIAQALIHWTLAVTCAALFLLRAPFSATFKTLFLFSFYPLYQYAAIARSYTLGILLLFSLVALHGRRHARPLLYALFVALLANVNAHSGGAAFAAASWFAIDLVRQRSREPRQWAALSLMAFGLATAFLQIYTPGHVVPPQVVSAPYFGAFFDAAARAFVPFSEAAPAKVAGIALLGLIAVAIRRNRGALWFLTITLAALAFIFTYLWIGGYRHYGLVLIHVVAALWLAADAVDASRLRTAVAIALQLSLAVSILPAVRFAYADLTSAFSGSREMATYVLDHHRNVEIAAHPPPQCEAVLPYLPRKTFFYAALGEPGSFMKWNRAYRVAIGMPAQRAAEAAAKHYGTREWLFLTASPLPSPDAAGLSLLYATHEPLMEPRDAAPVANDERYWLYGSTHATTNATPAH